jgi:hypothetical protein
MLIERGHAFANHPDFRELRLEIKEESEAHAEVESLIGQVEETIVQKMDKVVDPCTHRCVHNGCVSPHPDCLFHSPEEKPGPFKAGFTTKNM